MNLFSFKVERGSYYTPASLMYRYAKESGIAEYSNYLGRAIITIGGNEYGFDHWEIDDNNDGTETVNVYIFCVNHSMSGSELLRLEHLADTWKANQEKENTLGC